MNTTLPFTAFLWSLKTFLTQNLFKIYKEDLEVILYDGPKCFKTCIWCILTVQQYSSRFWGCT